MKLFVLLLMAVEANAIAGEATIEVSSVAELNAAMETAKPGDVIVMADGVWNDAVINFNAKASAAKVITLRAKTPGKVVLGGSSRLVFAAPYLVADGLHFKDGALAEGNDVVKFTSHHCRLTNTAIVNYNPADAAVNYYWVYFDGEHNRMDNCYFTGKSNAQPLIGNDKSDSRHNIVDHCYFKDIPYTDGGNGREIFRIWGYGGNEELGDDGGFFTVEYNLFDHADGEGSEIISLKSNYNIVRYNTILETRGGIVGRSGNFNTIEGNFILGNHRKGSSGIRVAGQHHRVINNYIAAVAGDGIILSVGEYYETPLTSNYKPILREETRLGRVPRYGHVRNGLFAHNTIVDVDGTGLTMAWSYKGSWPEQQRVLLAEGNTFANNIFMTKGGTTIYWPEQDHTAPLDVFNFQSNIFQSNIIYGGALDMSPAPDSGIITQDPLLIKGTDGLFRPTNNSPVLNKASGAHTKTDMDGQPRDRQPDIGADEDSPATRKQGPLTAREVGPGWMR